MGFTLTITYNSCTYTFQVELEKADMAFEYFKLSAGGRTVLLRCNRPMLQAKGLKRKPVDWKVVDGEVKNQKALEAVIKLLEMKLKGESQVPPVPKRNGLNSPLLAVGYDRKQQKERIPDWSQQFKGQERDNDKGCDGI